MTDATTIPVQGNPATTETAPITSSSSSKPAKNARGRPTDDPDTRHSKTLSYILRHGAAKEGLTLRPDGFVRVTDLVRMTTGEKTELDSIAQKLTILAVLQMKRPKLKGCDLETLERIVRDNAKQRFTMRPEPSGPNGADEMWIRANQGHSVQVSTRKGRARAKPLTSSCCRWRVSS